MAAVLASRARFALCGFALAIVVVCGAAFLPTEDRTASASPNTQAPVIAPAIEAVCGPGAIACVAAGTAFLAWYCFSGNDCSSSHLLDVVNGPFSDWWAGDSAGQSEVEAQFAQHPTWLDPSNLLDSWHSYLTTLTLTGWSSATISGAFAVYKDQTGNNGSAGSSLGTLTWQGTITVPSCDASVTQFRLGQPTGTYTERYQISVYRLSDNTLLSEATASGTANSAHSGSAALVPSSGYTNMAHDDILGSECGLFNTPIKIVQGLYDPTGGVAYGGGFAGMNFRYSPVSDAGLYDIPLDEANFGDGGVGAWATDTGEIINIPLHADDLVGWNGTSTLPLSNGQVGTVVGTTTLTGDSLTDTSERHWWEGLFDGVRGAVNGATNVLQEILTGIETLVTDVTGILDAVTALPAAIADLFDPTIAWSDFQSTGYPEITGAWAAVMPGCVVTSLGGLGDLYSTSGSSWTVPFPNDTDVTIAAPSEVTAVTYPLSTVLLGVMTVMWAVNRLRKLLGDEGSTSSGD